VNIDCANLLFETKLIKFVDSINVKLSFLFLFVASEGVLRMTTFAKYFLLVVCLYLITINISVDAEGQIKCPKKSCIKYATCKDGQPSKRVTTANKCTYCYCPDSKDASG
jgi:hypothetical protein